MYGLGSIIGNIGTSVITPAVGGLVTEGTKGLFDAGTSELLRDISSGTIGALSGAALGAGLGALTGGSSGAAGGALTGLIGGGMGAYKSDEIANIFGGSSQQPASGFGVTQEQIASPESFGVSSTQLSGQVAGTSAPIAEAFNKPIEDMPSSVAPPTAVAQAPSPAASGATSAIKGYGNFLKDNFEPLYAGYLGGSGLGSYMDYGNYLEEEKKKREEQEQQLKADALALANTIYAPTYADGGPLEIHAGGATVKFPEWFQEDYARSGGLASLKGAESGRMAGGGYINTNPVNPDNYYPQSQIAKAQPYPAAAPQRHEMIDEYEAGGLLEGDGDGMSDDIAANISGQEEVRVADGEYVVPKKIAEAMEDKLDHMLTAVRSAAHPHRGKQIVQDAAKRAFIRAMTGVHA